MNAARLVVLASVLLAGCVSFPDRYPTRPPSGRAPAAIASDEQQCESYAKGHPKDQGERYRACMVSRSYTANIKFEELGWVLGITQTRPHEPDVLLKDVAQCDALADNVKTSPIAGGRASQAATAPPGMPAYQRPNASRMLASCLEERGYTVVPWVPTNTTR